MTPAWRENHVVDPRRLWEIYDGEKCWIAAPTEAEAIALWRERCVDDSEIDVILEMAAKIREAREQGHDHG